jgi:hypothetical protein
MTTRATGRCLCGAVTYQAEIPEKPVYAGLCHCRDCQRYTGTAFASSVMVPKAGVTIEGELRFYASKTERGTTMERGFCPICGSGVLYRSDAWPDQYVLAAGTLDDPGLFKPRVNLFTRSAHAHVWHIDELRKIEASP